MENFIFSLNATAPIFLVMILGNILMKTGFLSEEFTRVSDKFVFKVALPALLFYCVKTGRFWNKDITWTFVYYGNICYIDSRSKA